MVRSSESVDEMLGDALYQDAGQSSTERPALIPQGLTDFAKKAMAQALKNPLSVDRALGELLTEPKANVWFDGAGTARTLKGLGVRLDRRSRMMYDMHHIFLNGESWRASGDDARLMRVLADAREIDASLLRGASPQALAL